MAIDLPTLRLALLCMVWVISCTPDDAPECTTTEDPEGGTTTLQCGDGPPITLPRTGEGDSGGRAPTVFRTREAESCPDGGSIVEAGRDEDGDGALSDDEVDASVQVCDGLAGAPGRDGEDGADALLRVIDEPPGGGCPRGGARVEVGLDANGDGVLDDDEVDPRRTALLCDPFSAPFAATALAVGRAHTCALTDSGGVKCWGRNDRGQLGDGSTADRPAPADVLGLTSGVSALALTNDYSCALTDAGGVRCWGDNTYGQLGDGTTLSTSAPVDAVGLPTGVASLALGEAHACALTDSGGVKCWGRNDRGQLGDGSTTDRPAPADVLGLTSGVSALALGVRHTCALTDVGGVACWGDNANGQLGDGSGISRDAPSDVVGLTAGVTSLRAAALHTCALTGAGGVTCWGVNVDGQLGDGSRFDRGEPVFAQTLTAGVASVALSDNRTCVVTTQGAVRCWGDNSQGQLGDTTRDDSNTPVNALDLTAGMSSVATTLSNTCAVSRGGGLTCWGGNRQGQVGDGSTTNRLAPTDVLGLTSGVASLALGVGHACALTASGEVLCWGANDRGQAGIGFVSPPVTTPSRLYRD